MKLTAKDLKVFDSLARSYYLSMPGGLRLRGETKAMNNQELVMLSYIEAAASVFLKAGLIRREDVDATHVELDSPDSDPDTEP